MEHSPSQGLNNSLQDNSNADIVISVDQTAPEQHATSSPANVSPQIGDDSSVDPPFVIAPSTSAPQEPALTTPARKNSESTQGGDGSSQHNGYGEAPRSLSPPHLPVGASFRGDPISAFRYRGLMASESRLPSIRSEPLPRQQHSPLPYTSSLGNEDHPMGGHHLHRDAGRPMIIDYAELDASVAEATLVENGFQRPTFVEADAARDSKERAPEGGRRAPGVDHAASTGSSCLLEPPSSNSGKSEFQRRSAHKNSFYSEQAPRPPLPESLRYTFFSRGTGLVQAPSIPHILANATIQAEDGPETPLVFSDLLKDGCYWLDILDPSDFDMQILAKHFHVHPLTIEDISTEEVREKYEVFRHYYFVCLRTFDQDHSSESFLQPASMYSIVFRDGIITLHFCLTNHHLNVLRRMEQLHLHITLTPDWINYALLDDITDSFASPIQTIEYEVDSIDELVLLLRENEAADMLRRIGSCRKTVMTMSRLLANKADVVRGLMKRFGEKYAVASLASSSATVATGATATVTASTTAAAIAAPNNPSTRIEKDGNSGSNYNSISAAGLTHTHHQRESEILLYLGDVLDHVLTMLQSLTAYEKILSRSHSNYLAQISLEINNLSNKTNNVIGTLTFFASLIVPMIFMSGLWGMNVHVPGHPGQEDQPLYWWWGIVGFLLIYCMIAVCFGKRYGVI